MLCSNVNLQCNLADSVCSYDYLTGATYVGQQNSQFGVCDNFQWTDNLGPIAMNTQTLCVVNGTRPVASTRHITPFGDDLGWENTTIVSWTVGDPDPSVFNVPGEEYCQAGNDDACNGFMNAVKTLGPGRATAMRMFSRKQFV